jgi:serine/threonine protein kinase
MSDDEQKAFKREVDAMRKLDNPFIIKLYEAFEQNGHYFLATEYADGGSLDKLLEGKIDKKLSVDEAVDFFTMMCLGLNYIHSHGFVHRDISPKNLFLKKKQNNEGYWLLIGDLGLARNVKDKTTINTMNSMGTIPYCPPEFF